MKPDAIYYEKECEETDMDLKDAMLLQQLRQKQELKQQCLHADDSSPLHKESEKLLALSKLADDEEEQLAFTSLLKKEQRYVASLLDEMRKEYDELPPDIQAGKAGEAAKNGLLLARGALHRLEQAETASQKEMVVFLEEAAFLLDGADGRA